VRRTRTQTRLSVEEKAHNVTSAFQVPDRFPLWARIVSRLARHLSRFARRFTRSTQVASRGVRVFPSRLARVLSSRSARGSFGSGSDENNTSTHPPSSPVSTSGRPFGFGLGDDLRETPAGVLASARHILLVDDTFTTGATLYACYAALRPFTNARISIATLAAVEGTPSGTGGVPPAPVPVSASTPDAPSVSAAPPSAPGFAPVSAPGVGPVSVSSCSTPSALAGSP